MFLRAVCGRRSPNAKKAPVTRTRGGRDGLQTMCEGGGMANATIIERLA
jgi:acetyl-CoA acetyltransferase